MLKNKNPLTELKRKVITIERDTHRNTTEQTLTQEEKMNEETIKRMSKGRIWKNEHIRNKYLNEHHRIKRTNLCRSKNSL